MISWKNSNISSSSFASKYPHPSTQKQLIDIATTKTQKDFLMQITYKLMKKQY